MSSRTAAHTAVLALLAPVEGGGFIECAPWASADLKKAWKALVDMHAVGTRLICGRQC